jgi:hypothetical protein
MTDLANKFLNFQEQVAAQHTEMMDALNTIAYALGAPPTIPTTNLGDIALMLTGMNFVLESLVTAQAEQNAALLEAISDINANIDTVINNNSLNAQRLLIAIAANDPCRDCTTTPIAPPPLDVTPQTVDNEHCKRMQALIYALRRFTVKLDLLSSFGLGFSPTVINDAISEIITELGVSELLEYPSLGEVAQLAGAGAAYIVSNIFSSTSLPTEFLSIEDALLPVLYAASNAADGQAAYRSLLAGSTLDSRVQLLFSAMAYTSIFNLYYDSTIELDLSGYDGTICAEEPEFECTTIASTPVTITGYDTRNSIVWPAPFVVATNADPVANTFSHNIVLYGDYQGFTIKLITGPYVRLIIQNSGTQTTMNVFPGDTVTLPELTSFYTDDFGYGVVYSIEICPPEPL